MVGYLQCETDRKSKSRENEIPDQSEKRRARDRESKIKSRAAETVEQRRE